MMTASHNGLHSTRLDRKRLRLIRRMRNGGEQYMRIQGKIRAKVYLPNSMRRKSFAVAGQAIPRWRIRCILESLGIGLTN